MIGDVKTLREEGAHGPDGCLSQHWIQPFSLGGVLYSCAEQYMMAQKAVLFGDYHALGSIMDATAPAEMKRLGRLVRGFRLSVWDAAAFEIVVQANLAKFTVHRDIRQHLLDTGDQILAEASPRDITWGIGLSKTHPDARNPLRWRGENRLGFALMQVRERLR